MDRRSALTALGALVLSPVSFASTTLSSTQWAGLSALVMALYATVAYAVALVVFLLLRKAGAVRGSLLPNVAPLPVVGVPVWLLREDIVVWAALAVWAAVAFAYFKLLGRLNHWLDA